MKNSNLKTMKIEELSLYYNITKDMIDSCLLRLKLSLPDTEKASINQKRLMYNNVLDKITKEINNRIYEINSNNQ